MENLEPTSSEVNAHSFIVKIWIDGEEQGVNRVTWRGHITHVSSNQRQYISDLDEIPSFLASYLQQMGVKMGIWWKFKQWLMQIF